MNAEDGPGERYETRVEDGIVYVDGVDGPIEVGPMDDVVDQVGGETYVLEYDRRQATVLDWIDTESRQIEFDVRETVASFSHRREFVRALADVPLEEGDAASRRVEFFADVLTRIWDSRGDLEGAVHD